MTKITVQLEHADQPGVIKLMQLSDQIAGQLYPDSERQTFDARTFSAPNILIFLARTENGVAAGCCTLHLKTDRTAEMKRLTVEPHFRKLGIGKALLTSAINAAKMKDLMSIQLEVGIKNLAAQAIYQSAGFQHRGPFGSHKLSPSSRFMERLCN